jgi:hypothetical protein
MTRGHQNLWAIFEVFDPVVGEKRGRPPRESLEFAQNDIERFKFPLLLLLLLLLLLHFPQNMIWNVSL